MKHITKVKVPGFSRRDQLKQAVGTITSEGLNLTAKSESKAKRLMQTLRSERAEEYYTWTTADGRVYKFSDLDDMHLVNIIRMIERKAKHKIEGFNAFFDKNISLLKQTDVRKFCKLYIDGFEQLIREASQRSLMRLVDADHATINELNQRRMQSYRDVMYYPFEDVEINGLHPRYGHS